MSLETYFGEFSVVFLRYCGFILCSLALFVCGLPVLNAFWRLKFNLPPGPVGLPVVGYLPFIGREPLKTFENLRKKYGNVYSLYMGRKLVVVLADYPAMKEAYSKSATLDRPEGIFDFQEGGFGFANFNGTKWVEQRRNVRRKMKDIGLAASAWEQHVEDEVSDFLQVIANWKGTAIDIGRDLMSSKINNICSLVFGKRLPPGPDRDMLITAIKATMKFFSQAGLSNYFPWLCNIMAKLKIGNYHNYFSEMAHLNTLVRKEVETHKNTPTDSKGNDFISMYLEDIEERREEPDTGFNESSLIGNTQAVIVGGSETSHTSLMWLFLAMAAYPNVQRNVHRELDSVLGREQKSKWEGRMKLPYTYAVIMESQRWRSTSPISLARIASEDFKVCGYDVPKGTEIHMSIWSLHNDSRYWKDPEDFVPERFLQNEGKEVNLKLESYVPFSYGKRRCPGDTVGLIEIFLYFTSIMQQYEIRVPNGGKPNLDGVLGLTYVPEAQELCFVQR